MYTAQMINVGAYYSPVAMYTAQMIHCMCLLLARYNVYGTNYPLYVLKNLGAHGQVWDNSSAMPTIQTIPIYDNLPSPYP